MRSIARLTAVLVATQVATGCSRFVWHEDPFTPDQAPLTEMMVNGRDTTFVLETAAYYLLAGRRDELWDRDIMDDVAWRYRSLFRETPPVIAVRLDSVVTPDSATRWRNVPFVRVAMRPRSRSESTPDKRRHDGEMADSARLRLLTGPMLAAAAAETWLSARTLDAARGSDSQPGGPVRPIAAQASLPAWMEAATLRILGTGGAVDRANAELGVDAKHLVPLATLFATRWTAPPNVVAIVRSGRNAFDPSGDDRGQEAAARARDRREAAPGASPLFLAQATSVLGFIHERDPMLVARLADELARGGSIPDVLAASTTLPHDLAGLDAAWREWLKKSQRSRR